MLKPYSLAALCLLPLTLCAQSLGPDAVTQWIRAHAIVHRG